MAMNKRGKLPRFVGVDFFCGAGGAARGMLDAGGYVLAGIDSAADCSITYRRNNRNGALDRRYPAYIRRDIADYKGIHRELSGLLFGAWRSRDMLAHRPDMPLLFAVCAPCQPFSKLLSNNPSLRAELLDGADLLSRVIPYIKEFAPDAVVAENVPGAASEEGGRIWQRFEAALRRLGYRVGSKAVLASDFGVAQRRKRLIMLAVRSPNTGAALDALDVPSSDPDAPAQTVMDAIGHLPPLAAGESDPSVPNHKCSSIAANRLAMLAALKPGENNDSLLDMPDITPEHIRRRAQKVGAKRDFRNIYTRMRGDAPSPCITTRFNEIGCGRFGHCEQVRGLSLREGAALQSFPDDYKFYGGSMGTIARMIGNALPPRQMRYLAGYAIDLWEFYNAQESERMRQCRK